MNKAIAMEPEQLTLAVTSVAANYIPMARILARSVKAFHPEWHFVLLLADSIPEWLSVINEPFDEVLAISDLELSSNPGWIFCHDIEELCTAIKPFAIRQLMERPNCSNIFYLDPDIIVYDRLDYLESCLSKADAILTPHQIKPEITRAGIIDNEIGSMRHGLYNLGFIGVKNNCNGRAIISWWKERVYEFCLARIDLHLWTDQKWFDHVPVFFDNVKIIKDDRYNVSAWNLSTRAIKHDSGYGFTVNGRRLGFYHFSGFNSGDHFVQAMKFAPGNKSVKYLLHTYKQVLIREKEQCPAIAWAFSSYSNGERIRLIHRLVYRYRGDLQSAFNNPFDSAGYLKWLKTAGVEEYGGLVNYDENRDVDVPDIPSALWIKAFPPEFTCKPLNSTFIESSNQISSPLMTTSLSGFSESHPALKSKLHILKKLFRFLKTASSQMYK